jgi:acyl-CoA reductase-like NAD-dependent aldehyde dehydrogenase
MTEEIFGPVMPVIPFSDLDEELDCIVDGEKPRDVHLHRRSKNGGPHPESGQFWWRFALTTR